MKGLIGRFIRERDGRILDYLILIAVIAVIAAFLFPNFRKQAGCIQIDEVKRFNQSISGAASPLNPCDPDSMPDWIASNESPGGGSSTNPGSDSGTGTGTGTGTGNGQDNGTGNGTGSGSESGASPGGGGNEPPITYPDSSKDAVVASSSERDSNGCRIIRTAGQLQAMNNDLTSCYVLGNNIDASGTSTWNGGKGFVPIGTSSTPLKGSLDGKGYAIKGIYATGNSNVGLIGNTQGMLSNITLDSPRIIAKVGYSASLVAETFAPVKNIIVTNAYVEGANRTAGVISTANAAVERIYFKGTVKGVMWNASLISLLKEANASKLFAESTLDFTLKANEGAGSGVIDAIYNDSTTPVVVEEAGCICTFKGTSGNDHVGFSFFDSFGYGEKGQVIIRNAYVIGTSESRQTITGFSTMDSRTTLKNIYVSLQATNSPSTYDSVVNTSLSNGDIQDVFYNSDFTGGKKGNFGTPFPTPQLKTQSTYAGWDFTNVWAIDSAINNGYPYLRNAPPK